MGMAARKPRDEVPLTEPVPALELLATGCEAHEEGAITWVTFFSERRGERVVVARIAIPTAKFRACVTELQRLIDRGDGHMQ